MRMCIPVKEFGLHLRRKDVGLYRRNAGRRDRMRQAPLSENEKYKRRNVKVLFFLRIILVLERVIGTKVWEVILS